MDLSSWPTCTLAIASSNICSTQMLCRLSFITDDFCALKHHDRDYWVCIPNHFYYKRIHWFIRTSYSKVTASCLLPKSSSSLIHHLHHSFHGLFGFGSVTLLLYISCDVTFSLMPAHHNLLSQFTTMFFNSNLKCSSLGSVHRHEPNVLFTKLPRTSATHAQNIQSSIWVRDQSKTLTGATGSPSWRSPIHTSWITSVFF